MDDYDDCMREARRYRELADSLDGYQRRQILTVVQELEAKARNIMRQRRERG